MPFHHEMRVRFVECDMQGVVFNAHYLAYVDDAMGRWMATLGHPYTDLGWDCMVVHAELDWLGSARYEEIVEIECDIVHWGTTSFVAGFDVHVGERPVCRVELTYVGVALDTKARCRRPMSSNVLSPPLPRDFYGGDSREVAPRLLGKLLVFGDLAGRIVEVEAYCGDEDPASHAFRGQTPRNATMFGRPGLLYVYFTYGMHWCANVVCGEVGKASAVLLRALHPVAGVDVMRSRRPAARADRDLTNGPAKLCQALDIERSYDGADLVTADRGISLTTTARRRPAGRAQSPHRSHERRRAPVALVRAGRPVPVEAGAVIELAGAGDPRLRPSADLGDLVRMLQTAPGGETRDRMLAFAADHSDALWRTCLDGHFTGSALVVDAAGERILFLFHAKHQRWLQPGGHADGDANLAGVALREAAEETGIAGLRLDPDPVDLDIHAIGARPDEPAHVHLDARFVAVAPPGSSPVGNHESEELGWFAPDQLDGLDLDPGTHRLVEAGLRRLRRRLRAPRTTPSG
jgi:DNA-3-methyladenine glycosylase